MGFPTGHTSRPTGPESALTPAGTKPTRIQFGKFAPMGPIFTNCFPTGTHPPASAVAGGQQTAATTSLRAELATPATNALPESRGLLHHSATEPIRLTFGPLKFEGPLVSPDGKKIFVYGSQGHGELVRYDLQSKQFVPFLGGLSATFVSFSRDRKWIAYTSLPSHDLWRSRVDGSERLQLTSGSNPAVLPRWSQMENRSPTCPRNRVSLGAFF
jgi:hypothetical protein